LGWWQSGRLLFISLLFAYFAGNRQVLLMMI
jgi:hypothetical protein